MAYQQLLKRSLISAVVTTSIGLTACGGGESEGTDTTPVTETTLSGKVADGYLSGATVCLDLNRNKICDIGEPAATSTAGGNYSLDATQEQIDNNPLVVEIIAGTTIDEDNAGVAITQKYTLTAPAGRGTFISPLTTMIQTQIETTGVTAEAAEVSLLASMGQSASGVSLFDDYVDGESNSGNSAEQQASYEMLHQTAQVTATVIANNIAVIESALVAADANVDLASTIDAIVALVVENIIAELSTISTELNDIASDSSKTFNPDTVATTSSTPVDETTVVADIAAQEETLTTYYASSSNWGSMIWGSSTWTNQQ